MPRESKLNINYVASWSVSSVSELVIAIVEGAIVITPCNQPRLSTSLGSSMIAKGRHHLGCILQYSAHQR